MQHPIILTGLFVSSLWAGSPASAPAVQSCVITVQTPYIGQRIIGSGGQASTDVSGTAAVPRGGHLWVLARRRGLAGWWPQGGGPANVADGEWTVYTTFGTPNDSGVFEIAVVIVDDQAHAILLQWVQNVRPPYPPTPFPNVMPGCPVRTLWVTKVLG